MGRQQSKSEMYETEVWQVFTVDISQNKKFRQNGQVE